MIRTDAASGVLLATHTTVNTLLCNPVTMLLQIDSEMSTSSLLPLCDSVKREMSRCCERVPRQVRDEVPGHVRR